MSTITGRYAQLVTEELVDAKRVLAVAIEHEDSDVANEMEKVVSAIEDEIEMLGSFPLGLIAIDPDLLIQCAKNGRLVLSASPETLLSLGLDMLDSGAVVTTGPNASQIGERISGIGMRV